MDSQVPRLYQESLDAMMHQVVPAVAAAYLVSVHVFPVFQCSTFDDIYVADPVAAAPSPKYNKDQTVG